MRGGVYILLGFICVYCIEEVYQRIRDLHILSGLSNVGVGGGVGRGEGRGGVNSKLSAAIRPDLVAPVGRSETLHLLQLLLLLLLVALLAALVARESRAGRFRCLGLGGNSYGRGLNAGVIVLRAVLDGVRFGSVGSADGARVDVEHGAGGFPVGVFQRVRTVDHFVFAVISAENAHLGAGCEVGENDVRFHTGIGGYLLGIGD